MKGIWMKMKCRYIFVEVSILEKCLEVSKWYLEYNCHKEACDGRDDLQYTEKI